MKPATVVAIDPGFANTGVAVMEYANVWKIKFCLCIRTFKSEVKRGMRVADDDAQRCLETSRRLIDIIKAHEPSGMLVELPNAGAKSARAARAMALSTGVMCAVVEAVELPVEWYTPVDIKVAATGRRKASKDEMMTAMHHCWPKYPVPIKAEWEHIADALATFEAGRQSNIVRGLTRLGVLTI